MSEAPRVELPNTDTDFDLSAPANQFQQTTDNVPDQLSEMDPDSAPQSNGDAQHNLQQSAIKTKDGLLESRVSGTERPRLCRDAS